MKIGLRWVAVALFLLAFANWATQSGIQIRREAWIYSRSIRYHGDVRNALRWGTQVVQSARLEMDPAEAVPLDHKIVSMAYAVVLFERSETRAPLARCGMSPCHSA